MFKEYKTKFMLDGLLKCLNRALGKNYLYDDIKLKAFKSLK